MGGREIVLAFIKLKKRYQNVKLIMRSSVPSSIRNLAKTMDDFIDENKEEFNSNNLAIIGKLKK